MTSAHPSLAGRKRTPLSSQLRLLGLAAIAVLPPAWKPACYRLLFGYRIGRDVRIGFSLIDAKHCEIAEHARIGHANLVIGVGSLRIGAHAKIGFANLLRGGTEIDIGAYARIMRCNEINSIRDPVVVNPTDPRVSIGAASVLTAGHKIDFTDRVEIGEHVIVGGRHSSIWTHNRQRTAPVRIGAHTYLGSESRLAPGAVLPANCIVGLGSVVVDQLTGEHQLIAGVPARPIRPLDAHDRFLVEYPTRDDLPAALRPVAPDE